MPKVFEQKMGARGVYLKIGLVLGHDCCTLALSGLAEGIATRPVTLWLREYSYSKDPIPLSVKIFIRYQPRIDGTQCRYQLLA